MAINGISSSSNIYGQIASGKRLNSAADGAAELSIATKENTQAQGLDKGSENIASNKDMLGVADGGLSGINDSLQRIRELAVSAKNATVTDSDRAIMQKEVDQLIHGINDAAKNTTFNTQSLLDGSKTSWELATNGNGAEQEVNTPDVLAGTLGVEGFDLTGDFDISDIDNAIEMVSTARAEIGAQSNALEYAYNYNTQASIQATSSASRLEDLDIEKAVSEQKKKEVVDQYQVFMQKKQQEQEASSTQRLLQGLQ